MPVQQEIKSQLAKLLATEDIVVEHKQVETAEFNVGTRVLILPLWEKASNDVYDMLVGHEVGHALFTPDEEWWKEYKIPHQFVNVVEDARIEKLIKRKYMGLAKSFYRAYGELSEQDFFELDGEDIPKLNLADRINLHYKIGNFIDVSFTDREKEIVDLIGKTETFAEVLEASQVLYDYCKQVQDEERQAQQQLNEAKSDDDKDGEEVESLSSSFDAEEGEDGDDESPISQEAPVEKSESKSDNTDYGTKSDEIQLDTVSSLEEKLRDLTSKHGVDNEYLQIPEVKLDSVIVNNKEIHDLIDDHYAVEYERCAESYQKHKEHYEEVPHYSYDSYYKISENCFEKTDAEYKKFKKESQKEVSYLVKEFECKKDAGAYSRASVSRTGVLDTTKLQNYKFSEDLFKKVTILPDGKNHGLIFVLDWSGSMSTVIEDTLKQLYSLIWFCKKVQIPFEVYAFTYEWHRARNRELYTYDRDDREDKKFHCDRKENEFHIDPDFNLLNFFSSKNNSKDLEHQMLNIWRTAHSFRYRTNYHYPHAMSLSGTPLNESLVSLYKIIPQFQKDNGVEKVQCIILTDGEADTLPYNKNVQRNWEDEEFLGTRRFNPSASFIRDRKLGRTYKLDYSYCSFTTALLTNMQDIFSSINFIGIRILGPRDGKNFIYRHGNDQKAQEDWRKHKSFSLKNAGYDAYFGISSNALAQDTEFDVDESATKAQIKRAFVKSLKTKKLNKKVLGEFISLVV